MPPKKIYTREQIIDIAFEIARVVGTKNITIRKVADKLGSSIAPIYVNFKDVDELIQEVVKKTFEVSKEILDAQCSGNPFQDIGLASLRFAKEYPVLFRDIVINQNHYIKNSVEDLDYILIEEMKKDTELQGFSEDELKNILLKMRVFQTGLSVMVSNGLLSDDFDDEDAVQLLNSTATDIVCAARLRREGKL
ncbi:MAG: TetR/AcrR family transcriptional regulator [Clostridiaceae bacterium]|nr:TetR/AcrR family transcriptional regulator [Clostridiaceae bacterium]